jgi:NADH-quinone oxidoreductase subunit L
MTMSQMLTGFILIPLSGYLMSLLIPKNKEAVLSGWVLTVIGLQLLAMIVFIVKWLTEGSPTLEIKTLVLYHSNDFEFFIDYYFDRITAVFALTGAFLTFIVALFSKYYMHRDAGFKRFFSTMLLFYTGYNFIVFSGNFETLFVGWEIDWGYFLSAHFILS